MAESGGLSTVETNLPFTRRLSRSKMVFRLLIFGLNWTVSGFIEQVKRSRCGRDGPNYFLKDCNQVLLADAYGGYNGVVTGNQITRAGCWAHWRRKVIEAEKAAPEIARQAIEMVRALYVIEKQAAELSSAKRLEVRQTQSKTLLTEMREKLLEWKEQLLPKHPMAEAIQYALSQWQELNVFCSDGAVPIDNNVSEREMKRVVLNRKNSLFVGNARGGRTAAILASLEPVIKLAIVFQLLCV
jgi:transposase